MLGCSTESVCGLLESGELARGRCRLAGVGALPWRMSGHQLRTYVQQVRLEEFKKSVPAASGLHLVPEKPTVTPSVPMDAC